MKYTIQNVSRRPITIPCNTGETRHLPPNYSMEFIKAEVFPNVTVDKLKSRGLIRVQEKKLDKSSASGGISKKSEKKQKAATK